MLTTLVVLFLVFDAWGKLFAPASVAQASVRLGISIGLDHALDAVLSIGTALDLFRMTSVLGAAILTGYLGGAVAVQIHVASPLFETLFPALFAVLLWAGLVLRDAEVRVVVPVRRQG